MSPRDGAAFEPAPDLSHRQFLASSVELSAQSFRKFDKRYVTLNEQSSHMIDNERSPSNFKLRTEEQPEAPEQ